MAEAKHPFRWILRRAGLSLLPEGVSVAHIQALLVFCGDVRPADL